MPKLIPFVFFFKTWHHPDLNEEDLKANRVNKIFDDAYSLYGEAKAYASTPRKFLNLTDHFYALPAGILRNCWLLGVCLSNNQP